MLALCLLPRMLSTRTLEFTEFMCTPDLRDILLVVQRFDRASNVSAHAIFVVPEGTFLVKEVYSVVREEVGIVGKVVDGGFGQGVEFIESRIRSAGIAND